MCCSVLQCVAVCFSLLQCSAVCCSVLKCVAACCNVLQCVAVCCRIVTRHRHTVCCNAVQCVAECCSVLQNKKTHRHRQCTTRQFPRKKERKNNLHSKKMKDKWQWSGLFLPILTHYVAKTRGKKNVCTTRVKYVTTTMQVHALELPGRVWLFFQCDTHTCEDRVTHRPLYAFPHPYTHTCTHAYTHTLIDTHRLS